MSNSWLSRYFIRFSYIGTKFSGVAKQTNGCLTVHNLIEKHLKARQDKFDLKSNIYISSRTDAGVHAIGNTAHFDLDLKEAFINENPYFQGSNQICDLIKNELNQHMLENGHSIRILDCQKVPSDFVSRHAKSRTYLYRLALSKKGATYLQELNSIRLLEAKLNANKANSSISPSVCNFMFPFVNFASTIDRQFITELKEPFDKDLFMEAIDLLNGEHDFSAFTTKQGRDEMIKKNKNPIKNVKIDVFFGNNQFLSEHIHHFDENYQIIDVEVTSSSFLYRMVRKTVGAAVSVAMKKIPLEKISQMFSNPTKFYDDPSALILKPTGLYLKKVEYEQSDLNECKKL